MATPIFENGWSMEIDYVVSRNIILSAGITATARRFNQPLEDYYNLIGTYPTERGQINDFQLRGELKYYMNYAEVAPEGIYLYASYAQGLASANGHYFETSRKILIPYIMDNVRSQRFAIGFGQQIILWNRITLGYDFEITFANLNLGEGTPIQHALAFESFADRYGPNIYSFGEWQATGGFGLSGHLKVGALLF